MTRLLRPQGTTILLKVYPKKPTPCLSQILGCKQLNQTLGNLRRPGRDWAASVEFPMPGREGLTPLSSLLTLHPCFAPTMNCKLTSSCLALVPSLASKICLETCHATRASASPRTPPRGNQTRVPAFHNTPLQSNLESLSKANILFYLKIWLYDSPAPSK